MDVYETLIAWAVSLMMAWAQPVRLFPNDVTRQQTHAATYPDVARDAIDVVYSTDNKSTIFGGRWARATDLALLLRIAAGEHGYIERRGGVKERQGGRSWCLMSLNVGDGKTIEGWTGPELDADRTKCLKAGYNAMKRSFGACRRLPFIYGLSVYDSGKCNDADKTSVSRINEATFRINTRVPDDATVMDKIHDD